MFEEKYKELMNEVKPDEVLVENMVERQKRRKEVLPFPKVMKVAAAILCGLAVLVGGTVAVDAATGGAVRKVFLDSLANGVYEAKYVEQKLEYKNHYKMTVYDENGKEKLGFFSKEDTPVFAFHFDHKKEKLMSSGLFVTLVQHELEPEDAYTWSVYSAMNHVVTDVLKEYEYESGSEAYEKLIRSIESNWEQIDRSKELGEACALGVQYALEDLKENRNCRVLSFRILDKVNLDEHGNYTVRGISYAKIDLDEWMRENEENGTTEFIAEADGGVKKTYKVKVSSFSPFAYTYEPVE